MPMEMNLTGYAHNVEADYAALKSKLEPVVECARKELPFFDDEDAASLLDDIEQMMREIRFLIGTMKFNEARWSAPAANPQEGQ